MQPYMAKIEDYLPLLIFFALWWIMAKKKRANRHQPPKSSAPAAGRTGEAFNLHEVLRQLLSGQVEVPRPMNRRPAPAPMPPSEPRKPTAGDATGRLSLMEKKEKSSLIAVKSPSPTTQVESAPSPVLPGLQAGRGPQPEPPLPAAMGTVGRRELRKAVIWSEILGPPVGLRGE